MSFITPEGEITQRQAAQILIDRREARSSFSFFMQKIFPVIEPGIDLQWNWHMDLICEYLQGCADREINKLIINIPPRNMKSILGTVGFPAWLLGVNPSEQIITSSYSSRLSTKHSVETRLILESNLYSNIFPDTKIEHGQNQKSEFVTTKRGYRIATSVGGTATGSGGNILIVDDPLDPKRAASDVERESANVWMDQTWSSRRNNPKKAVEIAIMQRLHQKDVTGHLLSQGGWEHLCIPMECEKPQIYSYGKITKTVKKKELLHPERFDAKEIESFKVRLGSYGFSAQMQQEPAPSGGGIVNIAWFKRFTCPPVRFDKITISLDTAFKEADINDPSVALIFGTTTQGHYLLDVWKGRVGYPALKRITLSLLDKWKPNEALIEDKASGQSLIQDLQTETTYNIIKINPGMSGKIVRMDNEAPSIEAGNVYLPESAPWLYDFEQEVQLFPNSENKDQVDALSQFLKRQRAASEIYIG